MVAMEVPVCTVWYGSNLIVISNGVLCLVSLWPCRCHRSQRAFRTWIFPDFSKFESVSSELLACSLALAQQYISYLKCLGENHRIRSGQILDSEHDDSPNVTSMHFNVLVDVGHRYFQS